MSEGDQEAMEADSAPNKIKLFSWSKKKKKERKPTKSLFVPLSLLPAFHQQSFLQDRGQRKN